MTALEKETQRFWLAAYLYRMSPERRPKAKKVLTNLIICEHERIRQRADTILRTDQ